MKKLILLFTLLLFIFSAHAQNIIYVNDDATGANDGSSWSDAFSNFQTGVDSASDGDSVFVAAGTYQPAAGESFSMKQGVKIYGGFAGTESSLAQRDLGSGDTSILKGNGASVIQNINNGLDKTAVLDRFKITGGDANGGLYHSYGGGMYNNSASPTVTNCTFAGNNAEKGGGGMDNSDSSPTVTNCTFLRNTADNGGGMANVGSGPTVTNCIFLGNNAYNGGGMYNNASAPTVANCTFSGNNSGFRGGGMHNFNNSSPRVTNCTFSGNNASNGGGMSNNHYSSPTVTNCIIYGNSSGIYNNDPYSTPSINYSLVQGLSDITNGNLDGTKANPMFIQPVADTLAPTNSGDYRLQRGSKAINKGTNEAIPVWDTTDLIGNLRIFDGTVDMGAYESQHHYPRPDANGILYVDSAAVSGGNGSSWDKALSSLEFALRVTVIINAAATVSLDSVRQIWVAKGTYQPASGQSFAMLQHVKIYGGFQNGQDLSSRNLGSGNASILKGNNNSVIRNEDNGLDTSSVLDGFKITGGYTYINGGGMFNYSSSPTVTNCTFSGNNANHGGGIYNTHSSPQIRNCLIVKNTASLGSGIYNFYQSSPILTNVTITLNYDLGYSSQPDLITAVIFNADQSTPVISNSIIVENYSKRLIYSVGSSNPKITYSMDDGHYILEGNIQITNPENVFMDYTHGDYRLKFGSPAINVGNNDYIPNNISTDLSGNPRIFDKANGGIVDMGAYEYQHAPVHPNAAGIIYVDSSAAPGGDGSSWNKALSSFSDALAAAKSINASATTFADSLRQIWVAKGTYRPEKDSFFYMLPKVKIYGGFAGTESSLAARDLSSGDISILKGNDTSVIRNENNGLDTSAVLNGFKITSGVAYQGGGMFNSSSSPTVTNCTFSGNDATFGGGGMFNYSSSPTVTNCTFSKNKTNNRGGGMYNNSSSPTVTNSTFSGNKVQYGGGGGIYNYYSSSPTVTNCTFSGNKADSGGGMYNNSFSSPTVTNCTFSGNKATSGGGGMFNDYSSSPTVTNCTFSGNKATSGGGGMYNYSSSPTVTNCIIYGNSSGIYNNGTYSIPSINYSYSLVQGLSDTTNGNLDGTKTYLMFIQPAAYTLAPTDSGDYRLHPGSPAINKGNNDSLLQVLPTASTNGGLDLAGNRRISTGLVDMGAYEYQLYPDAYGIVYVDSAATPGGNGSSWNQALNYLSDATFAANMDTTIKEIHVAKGTYYPTGPQSDTTRDSSFVLLRGGVKLLGGYPSGSPSTGSGQGRSEKNRTILSGNINSIGDSADNSYHVMSIKNLKTGDGELIIDGFTITGGYAAGGSGLNNIGGGIIIINGGDSLCFIQNCHFINNKARRGGGIYIYKFVFKPSLVVISNATFKNNDGGLGGGLYNSQSSIILTQCVFNNNEAGRGGGMYNEESFSSILNNCRFTGNTAQHGEGGGMYNEQSFLSVTNCLFSENRAGVGGAMIITGQGHLPPPSIINCTFANNQAESDGAALFNIQSTPGISNCIFYGNSVDNNNYQGIVADPGYPISIAYSILQYQLQGGGRTIQNIIVPDSIQIFVDTANGDYRLVTGSPAINKGNNDALLQAITESGGGHDLAGNLRIIGSVVDMGAYEYQPHPDAAGILYVDSSAVSGGDGSSWDKAVNYLSDATAAANTDTTIKEIHVARGTYYPTGLQSDTTRASSFVLLRGNLKLLGGYPAGGGERDYQANPVILSGDINTSGDSTDNSYHVMALSGISMTADSGTLVIDGFTFTGGNASGEGSIYYGGLAVRSGFGGGMYNYSSSPTVTNCTFSGNNAKKDGGGIYNRGSSPTVTNCTFSGNKANYGGGMFNYSSSPTVTNCTFSGNNSGFRGGGMHNFSSSPTVTNCTFSGNNANYGGGMFNYSSSPTVTNCTFSGNDADYGGGMFNYSSPTVTNCTFSGNDAQYGGGGMYNYSSSPTVTNCTFSGNDANSGGGMLNDNSSPTVTNCIIYGNSGDGISNEGGSKPVITYSIVQDSLAGVGNIILTDSVTLFVDTTNSDYHLRAGSPAINAGNNDSIPDGVTTDLAGNARIQRDIVDMGAYESPFTSIHPDAAGILYVDSSAASGGDGSSWDKALNYLSDATAIANRSMAVKEIHVAQGTYYPTGAQNGSVRDSSFVIYRNGLKLLGGYPSTGSGQASSTGSGQALAETILSGDIGQAKDSSDNSYHVMVVVGNTFNNNDSLVIDGFTFTGGNAHGNGTDVYNGITSYRTDGGGMDIRNVEDSTCIIRHCVFANNYALNGAGIHNAGASPIITYCTFKDNTGANGGGMHNFDYSAPEISNSIFSNNYAIYGGGMLNQYHTSPTILSCTFTNNQADSSGGGIENANSTMTIEHSTFTGNTALFGGGIDNNSTILNIANSAFANNKSQIGGGAIASSVSTAHFSNTTFSKNISENTVPFILGNDTYPIGAVGTGGALQITGGKATMVNCLITYNQANGTQDDGGGAIMAYAGILVLNNCTLYGNTTKSSLNPEGNSLSIKPSASVTLTNSIVYGTQDKVVKNSGTFNSSFSLIKGETGTANHNLNGATVTPKFTNVGQDDFRLLPGSPAINAGNNDSLFNALPPPVGGGVGGGLDLAGNLRVFDKANGGIVDMGAYEYQGNINSTRIIRQPKDTTICADSGGILFSVEATGTNLHYQWQSSASTSVEGNNWSNISAGTNQSLTPSNTSSADSGTLYRVIVMGDWSTDTSGSATLTVRPNTVINTQPKDAIVCANSNATFTVSATGTALSYQWQSSTDGTAWKDISGETSETLEISKSGTSQTGTQYRVVVNGACKNAISGSATLTVRPNTVINTQPKDATVCANSNATFTVTATGTNISYQWQSSTDGTAWNNVSNGTTETLNLSNVETAKTGTQYHVIVSSTCGNVTSGSATLTVHAKAMITTQPVNQTVCENGNATFSVTATGTNISYQWQSSTDGTVWNNVSNGTTETLNLSNVETAKTGTQYHVIVSSTCGNVTSGSATLTVRPNTVINTQPKDATVCANSNATFSVTATGTNISYQWQSSSDGTAWNNVSNGTTETLNLSNVETAKTGTQYHVIVSSTCGNVTSGSATLTVHPLPKITITSEINNPLSKGDITHLSATGADSYRWNPAVGIQSALNNAVLTVRPTINIAYTVTGTSIEGCSVQKTYEVQVVKDYKLTANNLLSPNGDGKNDFWFIQNIDVYPNNEVMIYDRTGRMIYHKKNYDNQWNGKLNSKNLKEGTYYYVFVVDGGRKVFKGYIEVLR